MNDIGEIARERASLRRTWREDAVLERKSRGLDCPCLVPVGLSGWFSAAVAPTVARVAPSIGAVLGCVVCGASGRRWPRLTSEILVSERVREACRASWIRSERRDLDPRFPRPEHTHQPTVTWAEARAEVERLQREIGGAG